MPRERLLLALAILLVATSVASSFAALHYYQTSTDRSPQPRGSLSQDGSWNPFSDPLFWDPWAGLSHVVSWNYTIPGTT
jgi:hypothetical protein